MQDDFLNRKEVNKQKNWSKLMAKLNTWVWSSDAELNECAVIENNANVQIQTAFKPKEG